MKRFWGILFALVLVAFILGGTGTQAETREQIIAQAASYSAPEKEWDKTFGGSIRDEGRSVCQTSDGGYIIAAWTASFGAGLFDMWLIKTDANGNEEWNKTFGIADHEWAYSVCPTSDGGYVLAGSWVIKTDASGTEEWSKTLFGKVGKAVCETSDGGYIIVGGNHLIKLSANGTEEWSKTYGGSNYHSVCQTSDDGYIITGLGGGPSNYDVLLIKTDANGNKEWDRTFGGTPWDCGYSVCQTLDGGYIIAGGYDQSGGWGGDVWLIKTDVNGNEEWNKTFGGADDDTAYSVRQTSDGGYIIGGITAHNVWLIKTDANGIKQWDRTFEGGCGYSVCQTSDGAYIITGYTYSYGAGDFDVWLIKVGATTVPATVDFAPDTLNLKSKGKVVTVYIELPEGYDVEKTDVSTVMLNGIVPALAHPTDVGDYDSDGVSDLMVKFDRSDVQDVLEPGNEIEVTVSGQLTDGTSFEGTDTIRVIAKSKK